MSAGTVGSLSEISAFLTFSSVGVGILISDECTAMFSSVSFSIFSNCSSSAFFVQKFSNPPIHFS